jgi:predicted O-linked N-acetylglucosamine transferase (SPINDLY family)
MPPELEATLAALRSNELVRAQTLCRAWIARDAHDVRAQGLLARALNLSGDDAGARAAVAAALALDDTFIPAWIEAAALAKRTGAHADAVTALRKLIAAQPARATLWLDLALSLRAQGDTVAATQAAQHACQLDPNLYAAAEVLGALRYDAGAHAEALAPQWRCTQLQPHALNAWVNLGETLLKLSRHQEATEAFRRAEAIDAASIHALDGLSRCLLASSGETDPWLAVRERIAHLDGSAFAYTRFGMDCWKAARLDRARGAFERAIALDPNHLPPRWGAFQYPHTAIYRDEQDMRRFRDDWCAGLAFFERRDFTDVPPSHLVSCLTMATNFYLHYLGEPFVDEQRRYARVVERLMHALSAEWPLPPPRPRTDSRVRVGICSGFFRQHTVMKLFNGLIDALDPARFERSVFYLSEVENTPTRYWREHADHFAMGERDIERWVQELRARDLDVLIFLDIGMHPLAQALAALRFAPRQVVLWGHPSTSGFTHIDEYWTSAMMEADHAQRWYTERLIALPGLGAAFDAPTYAANVPRELETAGTDGRVHGFFAQSAYKILPNQYRALARICAAVPNLVLHMTPFPKAVVREDLRARMTTVFAEHGVDLNARLGVYRFVDEPEFLGIAERADFCLDALGWSGGNTAFEIFSRDVPIATLPGELMRSRHTYAMLKLMELDELIARDEDDYVRIAVRLAQDTDWRLGLRERIGQRKYRLYEHATVREAFARLCAAAPPSPDR